MASSRVLLIMGSGANVGSNVARAFAEKGYKVAATSRTARASDNDKVDLHIEGDLADPSSVASIFKKVSSSLGPPSVVVYNAAAATRNPPDSPLSLSIEDLNRDFQVNTASVLAAAYETVAGFDKLPSTASRTFIYTGNVLNRTTIAPLLSLGIGKSATAHLIESLSKAYAEKGYRFYYADERKADGAPAYQAISGQAHADFYKQLAEVDSQGRQVPWLATFVGGSGYVNFER